jgi:hypothetical protein
MKWKSVKVRLEEKRRASEKHAADIGYFRVVQRFLWLPVCINDTWKWLEIAKIAQRYSSDYNVWYDAYWGDE